MHRKILIILGLVLLTFSSGAQFIEKEEKEESWKDRIFLGGNFGLMFGTITDIEFSPQIGYYITPKWAAGIGVRYKFYSISKSYSYYIEPFSTHIYGGNIFTRYTLVQDLGEWMHFISNTGIFTQAEYEALSLERRYFDTYTPEAGGRYIDHAFFIGGGISQSVGKRSSFYMLILYNLNETSRSPYSNPVIRVGFNI